MATSPPTKVRAGPPTRRAGRLRGALGLASDGFTVSIGLLGGLGWLYALQQEQLFGSGPTLKDALPLLQLAQSDAQPLFRVAVAWLLAGLLAGILARRRTRSARATLAVVLALVLLILDAQASYALTRNLGFAGVLFSHLPGPGVWVSAALFTLGATLAPAHRRDRIMPPRARVMLRPTRHA